ncbi:MAG: DNA polymerase III subunit delta [Gemmatimonadales bacterium]
MPRHSYDDLRRALKRSDFAPVYYLCGTEDILKDEAIHEILDAVLEPQDRDFNLDQCGAAGMDAETLHSLVNTLPMLAARRVVVIRDVELWKKKAAIRDVLLRYLANPADDTILILVEGAPGDDKASRWEPDPDLAAPSYTVNLEELPPERVIRWTTWHAGKMGITFGDGAVEHLARCALNQLGTIRSELEKLSGLEHDGPISVECVGEIVGVRHGETLDDWVEAVLLDRTAHAISLIDRLLEQSGMSGVKMATALGSALIGVQLARSKFDRGRQGGSLESDLMNSLRTLRPFGIGDWKTATKLWSRGAARWSSARLRRAIRALVQADMALKGTRIADDVGTMTDLVLRLGDADRRADGPADRPSGAVRSQPHSVNS